MIFMMKVTMSLHRWTQILKIQVLWDAMVCVGLIVLSFYKALGVFMFRVRQSKKNLLQYDFDCLMLKVEALQSSEMVVFTFPVTLRHIPEDLILKHYCCNNLKSPKHKLCFCAVMTGGNKEMLCFCLDCYTGFRANSQIFLLPTSHQTGTMAKLLEHWLMLLHQVGYCLSLCLLFYNSLY